MLRYLPSFLLLFAGGVSSVGMPHTAIAQIFSPQYIDSQSPLEIPVNSNSTDTKSTQGKSSSASRQQQGRVDAEIKGIVTDSSGEPLAGVAVAVKGTHYGTLTDADGRYLLRGKMKKGDTISFSALSMKPVEVAYTGQKTIDTTMEDDSSQLNEITVTAESNINNLDIRSRSGVVQTVDMKRLNEKPMMDIGLALQGSVPGLIVTNTGELGSKPTIRIRGNQSLRAGDSANEPLYVLDGKVISADAFRSLNPQDIREIKVLKDAAACALYGIKAANGVIEISSKRGSHFGTVDVTYSLNMGVTLKGRRGVEVMKSAEKLELERLMMNEATPGYRYSEDYYRKHYPNDPNLPTMIAQGAAVLDSLRSINTDWFNELMRNALYQSHNLSVRGGNEQFSYFMSGNLSTQGGQIEGNNTLRGSARLGVDLTLGKIGYFTLSMDGAYTDTDTPNGSSFTPASLVYNLNPYETRDGGKLWSYPNRTFSDLLYQYSSNSTDKRGGISASLNLKPWKDLEVSGVAGLDYLLNESTQFTPASSYSEQQSGFSAAELGKLNKNKNTLLNFTYNIRAVYNHIFDDRHDVTLSLNHDYYLTSADNLGITGYGVGDHPSAALINQSLTGARKPAVSSLKEKTAQLGVGAVAGYTFDRTYDLFATYKLDASSLLPSDKRWNAAWAAGLGWTPSNYHFMQANEVLTRLNLKGSYGSTASLAGVSAAQTIGTFAYLEDAYATSRMLQLLALYNRDLKPEQTTSIDAGLQIGQYHCLSLDFQWYRRQTANALLDVPVAASNGFSMMKRNIGILRNDGIEAGFSLNLDKLHPDWLFRLSSNVAYNRNLVVDLYYTDKLYTSDYSLIPDFQVGKAYDILYGLRQTGINSVTGLPIFAGKDGREIEPGKTQLTRDDFISLGHLTPPFSGTVSLGVTWRDLELDADFYWVAGGVRQYNYTYVRNRDDVNYNALRGLTETMWFERGDTGKKYYSPFYSSSAIETLSYANTSNTGCSDYLRLSMLSLRYRFPESVLRLTRNVIKYASVAIQASNLFTLTPYSESDPETGRLGASIQPVITMNLSLTF